MGIVALEVWYYYWRRPPPEPVKVTQSPQPLDPMPALDFDLPALDQYSEVIDRPLFHESRRPIESEPLDETSPSGPGEDVPAEEVAWVLAGVAITPTARVAFLKERNIPLNKRRRRGYEKEPKTRGLIRVTRGEPIMEEMAGETWQVREVRPDSVVITQGDKKQVVLELRRYDEKVSPTPAAQETSRRLGKRPIPTPKPRYVPPPRRPPKTPQAYHQP